MPIWFLLTLVTMFAAVALICHRVAAMKHASEELLTQYVKLLSRAREGLLEADEHESRAGGRSGSAGRAR